MNDAPGMDVDCQRLDELSGAIALGAMDAADLAAAVAHLESCNQPHAELRSLLGADRALASSLEPREPPSELKDRVLASAGVGGQDRQRGAATAGRSRPRALIDWTSFRLWRGVAIAAVVVLVVGALSWAGLRQQVATQEAALTAIAEAIGEGAPAYAVSGEAGTGYVIDTGGPGATFLVAGLERPSADGIYVLWLIDAAGTPVAVGSIDRFDPQLTVATIDQDLTGFSVFAVTAEAELVSAPTSDPVMVGQLGA